LNLVAKRPSFELQESFPEPNRLLATGPEGIFCHELVVPFLRENPTSPAQEEGKRSAQDDTATETKPLRQLQASGVRSYPPGSEWLYLKVYTGTSTADQILANHIAPLLEVTRELYDRWFFIRYNEGGHHLRLRFHGDPRILTTELQPRIHQCLWPLMENGLCWKIQLDTYEQEIERYGGFAGITLSEEYFWRDSQAVLALVQAYPGDSGSDVRWRLSLKAVDGLLDDMGFDFETKSRILHQGRENFGHEFNSKRGLDVQLGNKFRTLRKELDAFLFGEIPNDVLKPGLAILERRSKDLSVCWERLREAEAKGHLGGTRADLALSYTHMHVNRLLRAAQRAQEFVIYDFLDRLYESRLARARKQAKNTVEVAAK
jgi:thiopeptide-type bacteriocin biosynthesis protein